MTACCERLCESSQLTGFLEAAVVPSRSLSCSLVFSLMTEPSRASGLVRFLNLFTVVRPGEARTALLLALNVFLILMAYYILKTVREALILGEGTAELKSYLSAGQVVVLAFVVPFYGRLVDRFPRKIGRASCRERV